MPKVSIIIPVYNSEKYLHKCLDSVTNQTLKDIEIICINDGSTDNSLNILNEYASNDKRFVVISQKNQGQAIARNNVLNIASGEYIGFVDSDDFVELDMFEKMYSLAIENNCDTIYCNYDRFWEGNKHLEIANKFDEYNIDIKPNTIFSWGGAIKKCVLKNIPYICMNKLIKTDLIKNNNIKFADKKIFAEDVIFSINVLLRSQRCLYTSDVLYHYVIHHNSSIATLPNDPMLLINEVGNLLDSLHLNKILEKEFEQFKLDTFLVSYKRERNNKNNILKLAKNVLCKKQYDEIKKLHYKYLSKKIIQNIFSIKNHYDFKNNEKSKVLTIFGYNIYI